MGYHDQPVPGELDTLEPVLHGNANLVTLSANDPGLWGRAVAGILFSDEELGDFVLEPARVDRNTRREFPSPTRINKFKSKL